MKTVFLVLDRHGKVYGIFTKKANAVGSIYETYSTMPQKVVFNPLDDCYEAPDDRVYVVKEHDLEETVTHF